MTFDDFLGEWLISRQIDSSSPGQSGEFVGRAVFDPSPFGFHYRETGQLTTDSGHEMRAERRYHWHRRGQGAEVRFADDRTFHVVDLTAQQPTATHDCPPDWYEGAYDFRHWPRWTVRWQVRGPRKDYRMLSSYSRAS